MQQQETENARTPQSDDDGTLENIVFNDGSRNVPEQEQSETAVLDGPMQPNLKVYAPKSFGNETSTRDFKPKWFQDYKWLEYCVESQTASCYACKTFMNKNDFV